MPNQINDTSLSYSSDNHNLLIHKAFLSDNSSSIGIPKLNISSKVNIISNSNSNSNSNTNTIIITSANSNSNSNTNTNTITSTNSKSNISINFNINTNSNVSTDSNIKTNSSANSNTNINDSPYITPSNSRISKGNEEQLSVVITSNKNLNNTKTGDSEIPTEINYYQSNPLSSRNNNFEKLISNNEDNSNGTNNNNNLATNYINTNHTNININNVSTIATITTTTPISNNIDKNNSDKNNESDNDDDDNHQTFENIESSDRDNNEENTGESSDGINYYFDDNLDDYEYIYIEDDRKLLNANNDLIKRRFSKTSSSSSSLSRFFKNKNIGKSIHRSASNLSSSSVISKLSKLSNSEGKNKYNMIIEDPEKENQDMPLNNEEYLYHQKAKIIDYLKYHKVTVLPSRHSKERNENLERESSPTITDSSGIKSKDNLNIHSSEKLASTISSPNLKSYGTLYGSVPRSYSKNVEEDQEDETIHENEFDNATEPTESLIPDKPNPTKNDNIEPLAIDISSHSRKISVFNSRLSIGSSNNFLDLSKVQKREEDQELERLKQIRYKKKQKERRKLNNKQKSVTFVRIIWIFLCRILTFFAPDFVLSFFRLHERAQPLWREKVAMFLFYIILTLGIWRLFDINTADINFNSWLKNSISIHGYEYKLSDLKTEMKVPETLFENREDVSLYFPRYLLLQNIQQDANLKSIVENIDKLNNYYNYRNNSEELKNNSKNNNNNKNENDNSDIIIKCPNDQSKYSCYDYTKLVKLPKKEKYYSMSCFKNHFKNINNIFIIDNYIINLKNYMFVLDNYKKKYGSSEEINFIHPKLMTLFKGVNDEEDRDITMEFKDIIKTTIQSILTSSYDNHKLLLFVVCDGIKSDTNTGSIHHILKLFGIENVPHEEAVIYRSIGRGKRQMNYMRVYSGYIRKTKIPFIIISKIGNKYEELNPGNRGKRDSLLILLNYLNKLHDIDSSFSSAEYEIHYHLTDHLGLSPKVYKYLSVIDADTSVFQNTLYSLTSYLEDNDNELAISGIITHEYDTKKMIPMLYNQFIKLYQSQVLKSDIALSRLVMYPCTCCVVYRIFKSKTSEIVVASDEVINNYGYLASRDTLHVRSYLELGEDKILPALSIKNFKEKITFIPELIGRTAIPENFSEIKSQYRRNYNSIVHCLYSLIFSHSTFIIRINALSVLLKQLLYPILFSYYYYIIYKLIYYFLTGQKIIITLVELLCFIVMELIYILASMRYHSHSRDNNLKVNIIFIIFGKLLFLIILPIYSIYHMNNLKWSDSFVGKNRKPERNHGSEEIHQDIFEMIGKKNKNRHKNYLISNNNAILLQSLQQQQQCLTSTINIENKDNSHSVYHQQPLNQNQSQSQGKGSLRRLKINNDTMNNYNYDNDNNRSNNDGAYTVVSMTSNSRIVGIKEEKKLKKKRSNVSLDRRSQSQSSSIYIKTSPKISNKKNLKMKKNPLYSSSEIFDDQELSLPSKKELEEDINEKKRNELIITSSNENLKKSMMKMNKNETRTSYSRHLNLLLNDHSIQENQVDKEVERKMEGDDERILGSTLFKEEKEFQNNTKNKNTLNNEKLNLLKEEGEEVKEEKEVVKKVEEVEERLEDLSPPPPALSFDIYNNDKYKNSLMINKSSFDISQSKNLGNDSSIIASHRMNHYHLLNQEESVVQINHEMIIESNSQRDENYTTSYEYEDALESSVISGIRDSLDGHSFYNLGMHYSGTNSRVSLPQRYQRGQPNEKNIPTYTLSRTSRFSISSSTTSQYPLRPRIVSGTTYGSDYNPSNTTYSIISMTDVDYVSSWRESISTNTGSLNHISIIQDIHDEVYYLLKGTRDTPISKRAIRKHFSAQYGSSLVEIYGDFINECVSEFYQDNTNRHLSSTSSAFSVKQNKVNNIKIK
ncbi:chitin synthase-domain-containing protein [Neocallimastix lanati (nom. inval.)]|uniref:chitin synthase n=1 Tax=Neocallimastix californiae TaxID=1754190 RepID=A0A1Y2F0V1_9FUNG|nr:chitin synthase-domain-containing protein [Neocallimastix sp. JGI-2020a]ORY77479.1 hypothetical protein LY90DRAFT_665261 [Neocallimastix californiae]|eukprot:ORY77479.1 hypothetical protein LY90DRAFT_665261 [Neocallimastix californiae]